ncbi:MAG: hypothetical protein EXS31_10750 [Pedosphaera sp.]|nr:hypothetical protein [Pedosphaera sp.]
MNGTTSGLAAGTVDNGLKAAVLREILPVFRNSASPKVADVQVESAVSLLFELLAHQVGEPDLDAIGDEIVAGIDRWFREDELVKLADRYEPFCKFVLRLIDPCKYAGLKLKEQSPDPKERPGAAWVIKANGVGLVSNKELELFANASWDTFPVAAVLGQPNFVEHIARIYVFRNVDDHRARILTKKERGDIAQSFCVFLVWTVIKFSREINSALTTAKFSGYLQKVRDRFESIGARYVELVTESRSLQEYRVVDPLLSVAEAPSVGDAVDASKLPEAGRVTIIEAEPGAGKTTILEFLSWLHATRLLAGKAPDCSIPVFVELNLIFHRGQNIEAAVQEELKSAGGAARQIPWDSVFLLVDGLNEVAPQFQTNFKSEIRRLMADFPKLRLVVAGRPNSFRGEFAAHIVVLRRLTDEQLGKLFQKALKNDEMGSKLLHAVQFSPFLSLWARTPLHAAMIASIAQEGDLSDLANHAEVVRRCIHLFLEREKTRASATFSQTARITKETLLARLAFETKIANENVFTVVRALSVMGTAKAQIGATGLNIPNLIEEVIDNHLLQRADNNALGFAHELYHDYFAAVELEVRQGLGVEFALSHFAELNWQECIRLFAGLTSSNRVLIECGAERNPLLAWLLLKDASSDESSLSNTVALAAYSVLEVDLRHAVNAGLSAAGMLILADLGRSDLLEQAIIRQRQILEPAGLGNLPEKEHKEEERKIQTALVPLIYGMLTLFRLGTSEHRRGEERQYCAASRAAIRALKRIKAARVLTEILASWTGKNFDPASLVPGVVLEAIIELDVDEVLVNEVEAHNKILAEWLALASEAGFKKAWTAYGRILRLASRDYVSGIEYEPDKALHWLRKAHQEKDTSGSLELALLLIEEPDLANEPAEGEFLLRKLAAVDGMTDGQFELGRRLLKGEGLPQNELQGFELLLALAEKEHRGALLEMMGLLGNLTLPSWAAPFEARLKALKWSRL